MSHSHLLAIVTHHVGRVALSIVVLAAWWANGTVAAVNGSHTAGAQDEAATTPDDEHLIDFATDIRPLIVKHCLECHGPTLQEGEMRVDERDTVLDGYITAEDAASSDFYLRLISDDEEYMMPPPGEPAMQRSEIAMIKLWIDEGANWPEEVAIEAATAEPQDRPAGGVTWWDYFLASGALHPATVHFPVALLIVGALFALFSFRSSSSLSEVAYWCLWLGAWTAAASCVYGWSFAIGKGHVDYTDFDFTKPIVLHRWGGIAVAVLAFVVALIARGTRRRDPYATGALWKLGLVGLAVLVGFVGHFGGDMTHSGMYERALQRIGWGDPAPPAAEQPASPPADENTVEADAPDTE